MFRSHIYLKSVPFELCSSAAGLQNALSTLSQFCSDWRMNINTKKTKVMIFQKKLRKSTLVNHNFSFMHGSIPTVTIPRQPPGQSRPLWPGGREFCKYSCPGGMATKIRKYLSHCFSSLLAFLWLSSLQMQAITNKL